jgi:tRNA pseudouridine38-40 synthase
VQQELETAASEMAQSAIRIHGAGRTDAGVHALAQVAAFVTDAEIPLRGWRLGLNSKLSPDIAVIDARVVRDGYDPRRASAGKRYRYLISTLRSRDPLMRDRAWHVYDPLDLTVMRRCAEQLLGWHDFAGFRAADCERTSTTRHIFRTAVIEGFGAQRDLLAFEIEGTAFLKNMVRIIVGTLVDVARGRLPPDTVERLFVTRDRTLGGVTAPPQGLYLDAVWQQPEWLTDDPDEVLTLRPQYAENVVRSSAVPLDDHSLQLDEQED